MTLKAPGTPTADPNIRWLRHTVASLAYRAGKALRGAPAEFAHFRVAPTSRTPAQIVVHLGDLFDWALSLAQGEGKWHNSAPKLWEQDVARFFAALEAFDHHLASNVPLGCSAERLFQAPVADALAHVGQIAMLRRLAGSPVRGENYFDAGIVEGRVGPEQSPPKFEFD